MARNLDHGDRDSLGLFQQRPSQGWGTPAQIMSPAYAATAFYRRLLEVRDWQRMSVNDAAQTVQRSATPTAYGQHEPAARAITAAVSGATCNLLQAGGQAATSERVRPRPNRAAVVRIEPIRRSNYLGATRPAAR